MSRSNIIPPAVAKGEEQAAGVERLPEAPQPGACSIAIQLAVLLALFVAAVCLLASAAVTSHAAVAGTHAAERRIADAQTLRRLATRLQVERGTSCMHHQAAKGAGADKTEKLRAARRAETEISLTEVEAIVWNSVHYKTVGAFRDALNQMRRLIERNIDESCDFIMSNMHTMITNVIQMIITGLVGGVEDTSNELNRQLGAYGAWTLALEFIGMKRGYGSGYFARGTIDLQGLSNYFLLTGSSDGLLSLASFISPELANYEAAVEANKPALYRNLSDFDDLALSMARVSAAPAEEARADADLAIDWFDTMTDWMKELDHYEAKVSASARAALLAWRASASGQRNRLLAALGILCAAAVCAMAAWLWAVRRWFAAHAAYTRLRAVVRDGVSVAG